MDDECTYTGMVDWGSASSLVYSSVLVASYTGQGERYVCGSQKGISLLSVPQKIYCILVLKVRLQAEDEICEDQCGSMSGRGWV